VGYFTEREIIKTNFKVFEFNMDIFFTFINQMVKLNS